MESKPGKWYQCRICQVVCSSKGGVMLGHEKKHGRRSIQKLDTSPSLEGISPIWNEVKVEKEVEIKDEVKQEDGGDHDNGKLANADLDEELEDDGPPKLSPYFLTPGSPPSPGSRRSAGRPRIRRDKKVNTWQPNRLTTPKEEDSAPTIPRRRSARMPTKPAPPPPPPPVTKLPRNSKVAKTKTTHVKNQGTVTVDYAIVSNQCPTRGTSLPRSRNNNLGGEKVCSVCGYIGRGAGELQNHMRTHTKEKPFSCPACSAKFVRTQNMRHHIRFNCPEADRMGIAEKFRQKAAEHVEKYKAKTSTSDSSELHQCPNCAEQFAKIILLKNHSRVHNVGKNGAVYTCCFCKGDFYSNKSATDHMARVHNTQMETKYKCEHCGKYLSTRLSLKRHISLSHNVAGSGSTTSCTPVRNSNVPFGRKVRDLGNTQNNKISKESEDSEWLDTPKIVRVEHVSLPPKSNPTFSHSQLLSKHTPKHLLGTPVKSSAQNKLDSSPVQQYRLMELYEPEMEIGMGGDEFIPGNDPLAF